MALVISATSRTDRKLVTAVTTHRPRTTSSDSTCIDYSGYDAPATQTDTLKPTLDSSRHKMRLMARPSPIGTFLHSPQSQAVQFGDRIDLEAAAGQSSLTI